MDRHPIDPNRSGRRAAVAIQSEAIDQPASATDVGATGRNSRAGIEEIGPDLWDFDHRCVRASFFLPHLLPCSRLVHLTLGRCAFDEDAATALCQTLPQLREMKLINVHWPSLEPLRHLLQLESFSLQQSYARISLPALAEFAYLP